MKFIFYILIFQTFCFSQSKKDVYDLPIPKNIKGCHQALDKTLTEKEIEVVKNTAEDSISFTEDFKEKADFFHAWKIYDGSVLTKYFNKKGLYGFWPIYETILITYHRHLTGKNIDLENLILKYQAQQQKDKEFYISQIKKDSISGTYIPKDLKDCFLTLDKTLSEQDKSTIRNAKNKSEVLLITDDSLGRWIRNNWRLWGGSRLSNYFHERNVSEPEEMSAIILEFYYEWLQNKNENWEKWTGNQ
ncbi:hypothetical protein GCM10022386_24890 [Flavobacterium cheonhonense]|uniref:DUF6794 domain-containing protein n=1 Tax=Flavobacterium cheonhonense TaxID=706185 RepID=A0ABP7U8R1_9FLAO|nr:DUF6794 domain-containing protein [Flavobacterium cheonhonense]